MQLKVNNVFANEVEIWEEIYYTLEIRRLFSVEQKGWCKWASDINDIIYIYRPSNS